MKEKILDIIHKKLSTGFEIAFLTRRQFEKAFEDEQQALLELLTQLTKTYNQLINTRDSQVVKISEQEFIIDMFNRILGYNYLRGKHTVDDLPKLNEQYGDKIKDYAKRYEEYLYDDDYGRYAVPLTEFIVNKTLENISQKDLSIKFLFWDYFHNEYLPNTYRKKATEEITKIPRLVLEKFQNYYLSNKFLRLHESAENNLSYENLSGFETIIVNVGKRKFEYGKAGWSTTNYEIINNKKKYTFSYSAKDEKAVSGECINIFIFQKKYLIKHSITLDETEHTRYIIHRDCEKVSVKNECELVIAKHHGNETLVFDTRKDALDFQTKLLEIREGRRDK